ncbi:hypothetical protein ACWGLF_28485 [Streptomyces puniciscabiei]
MQLCKGSFGVRIGDVLTGRSRVVVPCTADAQRNGRTWSSPEAYVWKIADGRESHTSERFRGGGLLLRPDPACLPGIGRAHRQDHQLHRLPGQ